MNPKNHTVQIHFATKDSALLFLTWLCEMGEQDYWSYYTDERSESKDIISSIVTFDYWHDKTEFAKNLEVYTSPYENEED